MNLPVVYQCVTPADLALCYELISSRSRQAIGLATTTLELSEGQMADLVVLASTCSVSEAMCSGERDRTVIKVGLMRLRLLVEFVLDANSSQGGRLISHRSSHVCTYRGSSERI